jgi:hypothetical protein
VGNVKVASVIIFGGNVGKMGKWKMVKISVIFGAFVDMDFMENVDLRKTEGSVSH